MRQNAMLKGVVLLAVCLASRACSVAGAAVPSVSLDAQQRVHLPGHVTIVPEEVAVTQKQQGLSSTAGSAQQHDASSQGWQGFDQQGVFDSLNAFTRKNATTRLAAIGTVKGLASQLSCLLRFLSGVELVSNQTTSQLRDQLDRAASLRANVTQDAARQGELVGDYAETLRQFTGAKATALTDLDLKTAAEEQDRIARVWTYLTAAHARAAESLDDADDLFDLEVTLTRAQADEQAHLSASLNLLAAATEEAGRQLITRAQQLRQSAQRAVLVRESLHTQTSCHQLDETEPTIQADNTSQAVAVRRHLNILSRHLVHTLKATQDRLHAARSEFQRLWRHELVARQEDALEEALTQSVTEAWSDLRWRRDVALALDAWPEAQALQSALNSLERVHATLHDHQQPSLAHKHAQYTHSLFHYEDTPETDTETDSETTAESEKMMEDEGDGLQHDSTHHAALEKAIEEYKAHMAAQRQASASLLQIDTLRRALASGERTPSQVLESLLDMDLF